ncbi:MAG: hypothetical protein Ctma_0402 [Catillopecten margaritatus gill symbiont]|uniref:Uncharacterized protein n=1 Tax=Catillopecten margaritatus gill symbiont TaxID=3083288 RepID=A0AAU6PFB6_9GAMM
MLLASIFLMVIAAGMYKFNYLANLEGYDVDGNKIGIHSTWDMDEDGINDCENDGSCDHTIDYSKPRYGILK